jgi:hypothetical protein
MKQPKGFTEYGKEGCCPRDWNHVPDLTGSFEMDAAIMHCKNKDVQKKIADHLTTDVAYKRSTSYGQTSLD